MTTYLISCDNWLAVMSFLAPPPNRPNTTTSRRLWRLQLMDPWKAFWHTQNTRHVSLPLSDVWTVFIDRPLFNNGLCSLSSFCRSSPQTSTETVTPPSLMLALASPSMTTLSSWSHGAILNPRITFTFTCINSHRLGLIPFLSLVPNQVWQRVWIQQPRLWPDGSHGREGVKPNWPSLLYATSHILLMPELCLCNKTFWYRTLCPVSSDSRLTSPVPERKSPTENKRKIFKLVTNHLFCFFVSVQRPVLFLLGRSGGVRAFLSAVLKHCGQWWNKVLSLWEPWPPFSLLSQQSRLCLISF